MSKRKQSKPKIRTFYVPKSVYDEAFEDIPKQIEFRNYNQNRKVKTRCHQTDYKTFSTKEPPLCIFNIMEAARQAYDDRNFRTLYEIIYRGMDIKHLGLSKQLFEYLCAAIPLDPKVKNKEEMLINAMKGFHILENDEEAKKMIENANKLIKPSSKNDDSSNDSDEDVAIIEEPSGSDDDSIIMVHSPRKEE